MQVRSNCKNGMQVDSLTGCQSQLSDGSGGSIDAVSCGLIHDSHARLQLRALHQDILQLQLSVHSSVDAVTSNKALRCDPRPIPPSQQM